MYKYSLLTVLCGLTLGGLYHSPALAKNTPVAHQGYCYSAYRLQQNMDLTVKFGTSLQHKKISQNLIVHVREISLPSSLEERIKGIAHHDNMRAYLFFLQPLAESDHQQKALDETHFKHPFLVLADAHTGKLIDIQSANSEQSADKVYRAIYDLFQYSAETGQYLYVNGNGRYQASITPGDTSTLSLTRSNTGYVNSSGGRDKLTRVIDNVMNIRLDRSGKACFYQSASGTDQVSSKLSPNAYVEGRATMRVRLDADSRLPKNHFFYRLTSQSNLWPQPKVADSSRLTEDEAFEQIPTLFRQLSALLNDQERFLKLLQQQSETWPHLAAYLQHNTVNDDLSLKLFWALDRIDSTASVDALASLAMATLSKRDSYRAIMALSSTSAAFSPASLERLLHQLGQYNDPGFVQEKGLILLRLAGTIAKNRNLSSPLQSRSLKQFLYNQSDQLVPSANAAVIDAVGNLGSAIDQQGNDILLAGLENHSALSRRAAAAAFNRIPYNPDNNTRVIDQLATENDPLVRSSLVKVLGRSQPDNALIKQQLLSFSLQPDVKRQALGSLRKINFQLNNNEVQQLEQQLRQEDDALSQRLLAGLILSHRRQQSDHQ